MDSTDEGRSTRRPSLYAAIRLARLVQHFRERLKARVRSRAQRDALLRAEKGDLASFESHANAQTQLKQRDGLDENTAVQYTQTSYNDSNWFNSLRCLDASLSHPGNVNPLDTAARDDESLVQFDSQRLLNSRQIEKASNVLDNTTILLDRILALQADETMRQQAADGHGFKDGLDFEKYLANVEHMLRCLQQAAFQALIHHSLEALQAEYGHWGRYLEQLTRFFDSWYSEWSSDRPPLSSTMPWNIKPSLVVLWGVCWMFYMPHAPTSGSEQPRDEAWMTQPWLGSMQIAGYGDASLVPQAQRSSAIVSHSAGRTPPGLNTRFGTPVGPGTSLPNLIGSLDTSVYAPREMTHSSQIGGHMTATQGALASQQPFAQTHEHEVLQKLAVSPAGLRTPVTSVPASFSDAPFATPTSTIWSPNPSQNQGQDFVTHTAGFWQQPNPAEDISSRPLYQHRPSDFAVNPYAEQGISTAAPSPNIYTAGGFGFPGHFGQHPFSNSSLRLPMTNQGYPMSPHSVASEPSSVLCPPALPDSTSPHNQPQTSPSIGHSSGSRRDSVSQTQDPPRNNYNQIYCDHPECAANPPTFTRKCEWSKHMDKHTRPYVCREPGCEKIRGFTYSGGLLRHAREVHRQHGGPKAPRFCPHKDCKRSTGPGFSRKENLNEHLRRVHRGVGIVEGKDDASSPQQPPGILPSQRVQDPTRKRRRDEYEHFEEANESKEIMPGASSMELRAEIKKLRQQLTLKEENLQAMRNILQMPSTANLP